MKLVGSSVVPKLWERLAITISSGGISVHLDCENEELYIDAAPDHDERALTILIRALPAYGFEVMPESECPAETLDDGTVRIWLAEVVE
ncbi:hypothetical protein [Kribbella italica]|uniref:Uncharacterized protein n=1 Tax=Kribbella italica TaxID=1540520 RepID=A0A7W9MRV2_9ACTN|nr:hypothetical protein [Kribbella italica]MBB5833400.1 hypothetical protein [Kribbella italica]